jgi:zinc protease
MKRFTIALLAPFICLSTAVFAQIAPLPNFAHDRYSEFKADAAVKYGTLPNGVRYAIQKWPTPKNEVAIRMRIGAGSLNESEDQRGLMHFLEHMAFNGSTNIPENEFDRILEREGLAFGADTNAYTSFDEVVYQLDMPKSEKLDLGLMLMRETASNLTLSPEAIDRERGVIAAEERARENPGYRVFRSYLSEVYSGLLMTQRLPIGSMEIVRNAGRDRFLDIYHKTYTPSRTFIAVVGDIDVEDAERLITQRFGDWVSTDAPARDPNLGTVTAGAGEIHLQNEPQLPTQITFSVPRPFVNYPDTSATRRKFLLRNLANSIVNERLERIARREGSPMTGASIGDSTMAKSASAATLEVSAKTVDTWRQSLEIADIELRRALAFGFTNEEFAVALAKTRENYARAAAQKNARRSASIVNGLVEAFDSDSVFTSDEDDVSWLTRVTPSLNPQDALKELREIWGTDLPHLFVTSSAPIAGGEQTIRAAWSQIRLRQPEAPVREATKSWDYNNFGNHATSYSRQNVSDIGVSYIRFSNGVRLVVRPSDYEDGRIRVAVRFGEGKLAIPASNVGLEHAIGASFIAGGLGRFDVDALTQTLAGHSVGTGFGVGEDAFEMNAATTPQDLQLQLQVFAAYLTDPAWRPDGFARFMAVKDTIYRQIKSTTGAVWATQGDAILKSGDQRFAFPTEAQFDALNLDDARKIVDDARNNGAIEIIIVGDVTVDNAISVVGKTFAALPARPNAPNAREAERDVRFPRGRATTILRHEGRQDQALGLVFWPMRDYGDGKEARALRILESILQIRLTEVVREQEGGSYSPSTSWSPSTVYPNYGLIGATVEVKPEEVTRFTAKIEEIAKELADGKIDEDLFLRARTPLIADFEETTHNNPWWANWLETSSFNRNRLTIIRDGKRQYEQVTLDEVKLLARQYLDPSKAQIISVLPGENATAVETAPRN